MRVRVRVTPRASRVDVRGEAGALRVRVTAPAVDGRANEAARDAVAAALGVRAGLVRVALGARAREKVFEVPDEAAERLRALLAG